MEITTAKQNIEINGKNKERNLWDIKFTNTYFQSPRRRGTRYQIATIRWIIEKQESSRKISNSALLTTPKTLMAWITINCGNS